MKKNNNAYAGRNVEVLIKDSISNQPNVISKIKQKFNINGEHTAGDYIFCKDNKWYEVRDQE
jgi:hypothetical protein